MSKLTKTLRIVAAILVAAFSGNLLPAAATYAAGNNNGAPQPVWCQFTSTWTAQQGSSNSNPNRVALKQLPPNAPADMYIDATTGQVWTPNSSFDAMKAALDAECVKQQTVTPTAPTIKADPCGTAGDIYTIPSTTGVIYQVGGTTKAAGDYPTNGALSVTITAVAASGYTLSGATSWTLNFTNNSCVQVITAPTVTPSVVCGANNDELTLPGSANYTLTSDTGWVNGSRTIAWTANSGFVFEGGSTTNTQTFTDTNTLCPPTEISLPTPIANDPCGLNNATWGTQPTIEHVAWSMQDDELVAAVVGNFTFPNGETSHNFGKVVDSGMLCPVEKPAAPASTDPCGLANATWVLPADTDELDWSLVDGVLSVKTTVNYEFTDHTTSINFGVARDSGVLCNATALPVTYVDECGIANDTYTIPEAAHVIYKIGDVVTPAGTYSGSGTVTITASATADYQLTSPYTFEYEFDNASCEKVTICHRTNAVNNPYVKIEVATSAVDGVSGNNGKGQADHYGEHQGPIASSEAVAQHLKDNHEEWGDIIPPVPGAPIPGAGEGLNWTALGQAMFENNCEYVTEVTPAEPTSLDFCYDDADGVQIPATTGITYKVNGVETAAGFVPFDGEALVVTAQANTGFVIKEGATNEWTFDESNFTNESCLTIKKEATGYEDVDKNGVINLGDKIVWRITVTNNGDIDLNEAFKVEIKDLDITITINSLDAGESYSEEVKTALSSDDMRACKATNTATFSGWRAAPQEATLEALETADSMPLATGSASAEYSFTCPTPGKGNHNPPATPEAPSAPNTGVARSIAETNNAAPIFALIFATLAYGALYITRRKFEQ